MYAAACLEDVVCEDEPAPGPPCGFQHATGAVVIGQPLVHRRLMYRFDRPCGWMNATFEAPSTGREFKVRCSDGDVLFLDFYRTKHGGNRGWVLLDAVDTEDATETNAICTVPHGWELIAKPSAGEYGEHGVAFLEGVRQRGEKLLFNFEAPYDWREAKVLAADWKFHQKTNVHSNVHIQVESDPEEGGTRTTRYQLLELHEYGPRKKFVVIRKKQKKRKRK